jgi:hypothetical protein
MAIKLGPILSFRGVLNNCWCVSVLVATDPHMAARYGGHAGHSSRIAG